MRAPILWSCLGGKNLNGESVGTDLSELHKDTFYFVLKMEKGNGFGKHLFKITKIKC